MPHNSQRWHERKRQATHDANNAYHRHGHRKGHKGGHRDFPLQRSNAAWDRIALEAGARTERIDEHGRKVFVYNVPKMHQYQARQRHEEEKQYDISQLHEVLDEIIARDERQSQAHDVPSHVPSPANANAAKPVPPQPQQPRYSSDARNAPGAWTKHVPNPDNSSPLTPEDTFSIAQMSVAEMTDSMSSTMAEMQDRIQELTKASRESEERYSERQPSSRNGRSAGDNGRIPRGRTSSNAKAKGDKDGKHDGRRQGHAKGRNRMTRRPMGGGGGMPVGGMPFGGTSGNGSEHGKSRADSLRQRKARARQTMMRRRIGMLRRRLSVARKAKNDRLAGTLERQIQAMERQMQRMATSGANGGRTAGVHNGVHGKRQ